MLDVEILDRPVAACLALDPVKGRILAELAVPSSAASLAGRLGLPRQKVNYHLRALEVEGLVRPVEERQWGGLTERIMVATAASYIVSPAALGPLAADPERAADRMSASYLVALAARIVREVGQLWTRARLSDRRLATLSIDTIIRFRSAADRAAFSKDLAACVATLAGRYHDDTAPGGRPHRLVVAAYPAPDERKGAPDADQEG
ncbi:ArsR/SmtB family transcription factor [Niveispirillum fermenti]|uniref:ArsR/SmtB family transcription factor n=1 Tax=Niveispirillum fermenti TaxID=1233113 RepID=UPI003A83846A